VSVWEFFWPLITGAALVVAEPGGHRDPFYLAEAISEHAITTIHFVPSMLAVFLEEAGKATMPSLRRVLCSGEALSGMVRDLFFTRLPKVELHNLYGPTEAAIDVTAWTCTPTESGFDPPIGTPIDNTGVYVLDKRLRLVPPGVDGELYIAGEALARGYLNRRGLTAERFCADPWSAAPGARMYRTGDLVRRRVDAAIDYKGRVDFQLKVRGFRIEPGEIESVLMVHPGVAQALVQSADSGDADKGLVAYVIPVDPQDYNENALRDWLKNQLPSYMVPTAFVALDSFHFTVNGKIDRRALPVPGAARAKKAGPRNETERILCEIFAEVLEIDHVGIGSDFFDLGGNSLMLTRVVSRIRSRLGLNVAVRLVYEAPTVERLADVITGSLEPELVLSDYAQANAVTRSKPD
jgi:acyl-coenzyme A synthetase/AMP-(fatty) acid ligase/acyl carrier protein